MDYALELLSPVRHVATELERADHALSLSELAATYTHTTGGDLTRVKKHEGKRTDREATEWIIEQALQSIARYLEDGDGTYELAVPFDDILFQRRKLQRVMPPARFEGAFDANVGRVVSPATGRLVRGFSDNIRDVGKARDQSDELRESLRIFGWIPELPALTDEYGVVLVGHRRIAIAEELGIEPVTQRLKIGAGDEADARRFRIAIASNLGAKKLADSDRKDLAEYLYGERDWTMARIAEALEVNVSTVSRNLRGAKKRDPRGRPPSITRKQEDEIIEPALREGKGRREIAKMVDRPEGTTRSAIERVRGRLQEQERIDVGKHTCVCSICGREDVHA